MPRAGDFGVLFQKDRTEQEDALFKEGLKASNVWYGHELTTCWMQPELPPGFALRGLHMLASLGYWGATTPPQQAPLAVWAWQGPGTAHDIYDAAQ